MTDDDMFKITTAVSVPLREVIRCVRDEQMTQTQMARLWGVSQSTLCQALKRVGLAYGRRGPRAELPSPRELVARMGAEDLNGAAIGRVLGVSRQRVHQIKSEQSGDG